MERKPLQPLRQQKYSLCGGFYDQNPEMSNVIKIPHLEDKFIFFWHNFNSLLKKFLVADFILEGSFLHVQSKWEISLKHMYSEIKPNYQPSQGSLSQMSPNAMLNTCPPSCLALKFQDKFCWARRQKRVKYRDRCIFDGFHTVLTLIASVSASC